MVGGMTTTFETTRSLSEEGVDGRTLRRTRNRNAVIVALIDITREGDLHPGASEIADRAGVSHRSIFRYFDDLDDLVRTAIDHDLTEAGPLADIRDIGAGPVAERIAALVDARIALYEHVDATMQLARMRAHSIPWIDECIARVAEQFRTQIAKHFEPELAALSDEQRSLIVDGILVLTSYDSFTIQVRLLHSEIARIRESWVATVTAILT